MNAEAKYFITGRMFDDTVVTWYFFDGGVVYKKAKDLFDKLIEDKLYFKLILVKVETIHVNV